MTKTLHKYLRKCKRCNKIFKTDIKFTDICIDCKKSPNDYLKFSKKRSVNENGRYKNENDV